MSAERENDPAGVTRQRTRAGLCAGPGGLSGFYVEIACRERFVSSDGGESSQKGSDHQKIRAVHAMGARCVM